MRKKFGLTLVDLLEKAGVGLRFVRELDQGKPTLRMDGKRCLTFVWCDGRTCATS